MFYSQTNGRYEWIDNWRMKYTKWAEGEPKQKIGCVYLDIAGAWKTGSCNESYFSVCKKADGKNLNLTIVIAVIISIEFIVLCYISSDINLDAGF